MNGLYQTLIGQFAQRWLTTLPVPPQPLSADVQLAIRRQAVIGWLQTLLLVVTIIQVMFAGLLRALPPDVRAQLAFLHRIEWAAYVGILLITLQVTSGWSQRIVLTNRFSLLAWFLTKPRLVVGPNARRLQIVYLGVVGIMVAAVIWVRIRGFIVAPRQ
jgi:hypothetical protein